MNAPIIAFFNNKGGIGKTSLVYHLAWMYYDLGLKVVAADLDPQANLTAAFLDEDRLEEVWEENKINSYNTIFRCIKPLLSGIGDVVAPNLEQIEDGLSLLIGDLQLSGFEDELSSQWSDCLDRKERAFRVISAFWRILSKAATNSNADVVLIDLGPNLGAINRAALIAADYVVVPLSPDLFSLQGLKNLGPTLCRWREEWQERISKNPAADLALPAGKMQAVGYIVLQHGVRSNRPVKSFQRWIARIPEIYGREVIQKQNDSSKAISNDPNQLALLKYYQSLMPMAQESRKPIFHLKPADGAIGSHIYAVQDVFKDFENLARKIASRTNVVHPGLAASYHSSGKIERNRGNWDVAESLYHSSLDIRRELGDQAGIASSYGALGDIERNRGNWSDAESLYRHSLHIFQEIGDRAGVAESIADIGRTELERGEIEIAEARLKDALSEMELIGMKYQIAEVNWDLARLELRKNNQPLATQYYQTAHRLFSELGAAKDLAKIESEWSIATTPDL